jgi:hypothetical protein
MTLIIGALTASGIVLTADSRQTYRNAAGAVRIGSDNAVKLFKLTDRCGVAISGRAFLRGANQPPKEAGHFVKRFAETENLDGSTTRQIADSLNASLRDVFVDFEKNNLKQAIAAEIAKQGGTNLAFQDASDHTVPYTFEAPDGTAKSDAGSIETLNIIVAGIDSDNVGRAYSIAVPAGILIERDTEACGALWLGQTDVITRIIKGRAPEMHQLNFMQSAVAADAAGVQSELDKLEYIVNWTTITLQDAVDFCALMTRTTANIQRFSDGTLLAPGGIPGVGGEIDIAVITPEGGFQWLKQKLLRWEGEELQSPSSPND